MQSKNMPFCKKPSKDIVESGKDCVGYKLNDSYQLATNTEQNKTEDSGMSNNHILGSKDRWDWEVELDDQVGTEVFGTSGGLSCSNISNSLKILRITMNGLVGVLDFL